ncbi:hypothetical protein J2Z84_001283 [Agrobacterium rubi]|nr:hypothetical protein [Agrobacterium rubi]
MKKFAALYMRRKRIPSPCETKAGLLYLKNQAVNFSYAA